MQYSLINNCQLISDTIKEQKSVHLHISKFKSVNLVKQQSEAKKTRCPHRLTYVAGIILSVTNTRTTYLFHYLFANMLVVFRWPIQLIGKCTELQCRKNNQQKFKRILWSCLCLIISCYNNKPDNFHLQIPWPHINHTHST